MYKQQIRLLEAGKSYLKLSSWIVYFIINEPYNK